MLTVTYPGRTQACRRGGYPLCSLSPLTDCPAVLPAAPPTHHPWRSCNPPYASSCDSKVENRCKTAIACVFPQSPEVLLPGVCRQVGSDELIKMPRRLEVSDVGRNDMASILPACWVHLLPTPSRTTISLSPSTSHGPTDFSSLQTPFCLHILERWVTVYKSVCLRS